MSESRVLEEVEAAASHFKICVLPRNPKRLSCSVWSMPDPAFHVGVMWRQNTGALRVGARLVRFGLNGDGDFKGWLFKDARYFELEAKTLNGKLSPNQIAKRDLCIKTGVPWGLVRSYDEAVEVLESWGLRRPV